MTNVPAAAAEQLLHDLVAIPSPSRHEANAVAFLVNWMKARGFDHAFTDEAGNAIGIIGQGKQEIVLLGHIDTFPGTPPVGICDRKLYGRGSVDAKGPLCAFAAAARRARARDDLRIVVIGAVEEEAATSKGAHHVMPLYQPSFCIIGEPSHWDRITLGYKGRLLYDWRWEGGLAHSAGNAPSPAEIAVEFWLKVKRSVDGTNSGIDSIFGSLDASIRDLNTYQNGANGVAEMTIGFRLPPGIDPAQVVSRFSSESGATVSTHGAERAFTADKNSALSRVFRRAIRAHGGVPRFLYKTGTSDMNIAGPRWNCPIVAYGPGDSALDHTPDEHLDIDEYLQTIDVLTTVLESI